MLKNTTQTLKERLAAYINIFLVFLVILMLTSLARNVFKIKKTRERINKAQERVEKLKQENESLKQRLDKTSTEAFIEKQLRDRLGLAKEGEVVVVLPDEDVIKAAFPEEKEEEEILPPPNWKRWLELFLD